jgi:hypothetical protein
VRAVLGRYGGFGRSLIPEWDEQGYTPYVLQRVRKWICFVAVRKIQKTGVCKRLRTEGLRRGVEAGEFEEVGRHEA